MSISFQQLCVLLVVGGLAGWIAGLVLRRRGFGVVGNLVIGVLGSFLGRWVLGLIGFGVHGTLAALVTAVLGAVLLFWLLSFVPRGGRK
jgi:uncharacterized membrane protein YeaQ/YmgE (transglycosylase-associated protein family)